MGSPLFVNYQNPFMFSSLHSQEFFDLFIGKFQLPYNPFAVRGVGFAHQQQDRVMEGAARPTGFFNNLRFQEVNAIGFYIMRVF